MSHSGCGCAAGPVHPSCDVCWSSTHRAGAFNSDACFVAGSLQVLATRFSAYAAAVDKAIDELPPGYISDCPAHMSCNLTVNQVNLRPEIKEFQQLLFDPNLGAGVVIQPCVDTADTST